MIHGLNHELIFSSWKGAYWTKKACEIFQKYPFVLKIYLSFFGTNKPKYPLLTVMGKDVDGKVYIILRCFLPNKQSWVVYRWLLMAGHFLGQVHVIITDGDSHEIHQLNTAIKLHWNHMLHQRCAWYLIIYTKAGRGTDSCSWSLVTSYPKVVGWILGEST
jgi:hypothetical protein